MSKSKAAQARVFVPLRKVDEEQRLVYGTITQEILDKSGEMMDYDLSKPHFEKWSGDISAATGGLSKGNVRVMHGMIAAGKLTDIAYDDLEKSIDVCAKIVDDAEWNKVLEGVYTGFSVGGSYGKTWTETVDGVKIKKFEAKPMEVSIVDNACVPTATFSLVKADGSVAPVMFKAASAEQAAEIEAADKARLEAGNAAPAADIIQPTNEEVVAKATEIALAKADGTTWMDHVADARDELVKAFPPAKGKDKKDEEGKDDEGDDKAGDKKTDKKAAKPAAKSDDKSEKVTPAGVMQKWMTSDGEAFEKKEDAVAHEESLLEDENDPAVKLKKALQAAADAVQRGEELEAEDTVFTDFDRLHKAFLELDQPRLADGTPVLEKGMYTVRRFADVLGDVASLAKTIKAEGVLESGDSEDESVASVLQASLSSFGDSFVKYAKNQVAELLAGLDVDLSPATCYDYYYRAAQADPGNELMKDVCSLIEEVKDDVPEVIEELTKAWGGTPAASVGDDDVSGEPLQKKFDTLQKRYDDLEKVANTAVEQVEGLVKRVKVIEDTPLPRAPRGNPMTKENDGFFAKAETHEDKMGVLKSLLDEHGADGLATMMIKASQQTGGRQMTLGNR